VVGKARGVAPGDSGVVDGVWRGTDEARVVYDGGMKTIEREAPAKINLMLTVDRPRDDGMHPIASWMCTVDLCDHIELAQRDAGGTSLYAIEWHDEAQKISQIDWPITRDLAVRAHRALEREIGAELPVRMRVRKRIPLGAGLGGGSSDAAAMLVMTRELFGLDVDDALLEKLAIGLGSDVAFFVRMMNEGAQAGLVQKMGGDVEVTPVPRVDGGDGFQVLLMMTACACSTGAVYGKFDAMRGVDHTFRDVEVARAARGGVVRAGELFNDLEEAACDIEGKLYSARRQAEEALGVPVRVTGSGSGMFAVYGSREEAMEASGAIAQASGIQMRIVISQ
jgi:4-diphosphocytidyl-2-C-methyl-D-erythritol kinase